jgi:hypothetical protein
VTADRLQRRVTELSDWLAGLASAAPRRQQRQQRTGGGTAPDLPASRAPYSRHERTLIMSASCPTAIWTSVLIVAWACSGPRRSATSALRTGPARRKPIRARFLRPAR